jgi:hypothetical protein
VGEPAGNKVVMGNFLALGAVVSPVTAYTASLTEMVRLVTGETGDLPGRQGVIDRKKRQEHRYQKGAIRDQFSPLKNMAIIVNVAMAVNVATVIIVTRSWSPENHLPRVAGGLIGSQGRRRKNPPIAATRYER